MKLAKCFFPALMLFLVVNCSSTKSEVTETTQENLNVNIAAQNSSDSEAAQEGSAGETQSPKTAPDAVIKDLYKTHEQDMKGQDDRILNGKSRTVLDKYFDKNLAGLIWKDLTTHKDEVGVLDFDPFYSAQDFDIKKLFVGQPKIAGNKATVIVTFENFGKKDTLGYALVQQNSAWRIADIKYKEGNSLLGYFKEDAKNNAANTDGKEGNFEGTYQVGETTCIVKPIKMAFELKWSKGSGAMVFFFTGEGGQQFKFSSEDKGKGIDTFVFDNAGLTTGKFIRADGKEMPVKKIK